MMGSKAWQKKRYGMAEKLIRYRKKMIWYCRKSDTVLKKSDMVLQKRWYVGVLLAKVRYISE